ncbi:MAG: single-stranded-DNA-specific exonuclease RecJ [Chloroflexota bacterium]
MSAVMPKRWLDPPLMPDAYCQRFPHLHPIVLQILYNRQLREPETVQAFLAADAPLHDPFLMSGMAVAVERIERAIRRGERIAVYGDFDADGITATALLTQTLTALGATAAPYIPDRIDEGYGLNTDALENLAAREVKLVVTTDCGIRSAQEVAHGNQLGLDLILTDHHSVGPELPPALAVINPKQPGCDYPFKGLAGVGIAFKLAQALMATVKKPGRLTPLRQEHLLDLVALGTVADIVPLTDENRTLVRRGLVELNAPRRKGIQALTALAGVKAGQITSTTIGFVLGPRLNAAGRLQDAMQAYYLLLTKDPDRAKEYAGALDHLNQKRQHLTQTASELARTQVLDDSGQAPYLLFAGSPDFHPGIVGLVASRLTDEFYRPSIVLEYGESESRGSCRSIAEFHITRALDECADLLERHGGHAMAAGFTVRNENLPALQERLLAIASQQLAGEELTPRLQIDAELTLGPDLYQLYEQLEQLQPFGEANPMPLLVSRGLRVRQAQAIGAEGQHLKLRVSDGRALWDGVAFRRGQEVDNLPTQIDLAYHLDMNEWNGEKRPQLIVQDWQPSS